MPEKTNVSEITLEKTLLGASVMKSPLEKSPSRRQFLQTTAAGAAAIGTSAIHPVHSWAAGQPSQINIGIVGCGWRGGQLLGLFLKVPGVNIVGLCDVDQELVSQLGEQVPKASQWTDMRQMFESPAIDAVIIATCNHWHCLAAIWAMQAGKHVYVEKPLGHTQWEGEQVVKACKKYDRICQVGTQQRSNPMQTAIKQLLHEEKAIGEVESVRINRFGVRESIGRRSKPLVPPKSVDYNLWLGPAQEMPLFRDKLHYDWHWDWNTGSGEMGNWGVHIIDDVRNNVFQDKVAAPSAVTATGGRFQWNDAGNTPNVHFAELDAGGIPVVVTLSNLPLNPKAPAIPGPSSGYVVYCAGGRLEGQRKKAEAFDAEGKLIKEFKAEGWNARHQQNFIDAVRENQPSLLIAPAQVGHDSTSWCNLINIATRVPPVALSGSLAASDSRFGTDLSAAIFNRMQTIASASGGEGSSQFMWGPRLQYDTQKACFVGGSAEAANQFLRREYRQPFAVPEIS